MKRIHLEGLLWLAAGLVTVSAYRASRDLVPPPDRSAGASLAAPAAPQRLSRTLLLNEAGEIARSAPFRMERRPSPVPFSPRPGIAGAPSLVPPAAPAPPRPQLSVSGIVGPPWTALLDGVPGREGPVTVRTGDRVAGMQIRRVDQTGVVVTGMDTTWRLTLSRKWQ